MKRGRNNTGKKRAFKRRMVGRVAKEKRELEAEDRYRRKGQG